MESLLPLLLLGNPLLSFRAHPKWEPSHPKYSPLLLGVSQDFVTHLPSPQTCGQGRVLALETACPQLGVCEITISQKRIQRLREVRWPSASRLWLSGARAPAFASPGLGGRKGTGQLESSLQARQRVLSMGGLARDGHLTTLLSKAASPQASGQPPLPVPVLGDSVLPGGSLRSQPKQGGHRLEREGAWVSGNLEAQSRHLPATASQAPSSLSEPQCPLFKG